MKPHLQTTLLALCISLLISCFAVSADTAKTMPSQVKYNYYGFYFHHEKRYHHFLPSPAPEGLLYHVRMTADANIDDTPEKETVVLIVVGPKPRPPYDSRKSFGNWPQAFLLITENTADGVPKKKAFFKLFDTGTHPLEVPAAKVIELHSPPPSFKLPTDVSLRLADMTSDGTLDIWVESAHGVALISFENGGFKEVFSRYPVTREKLTKTAEVEYYSYEIGFDPEGHKYHRFLPPPPAKGVYYDTQRRATANIDDTPEKENIVLMTAETGHEEPRSEPVQVFLLIAENNGDMLKKKALFKLFDAGTYGFDVPRETIDLQSAPLILPEKIISRAWLVGHVWFRLVDLTGDGTLDVWIESYYGVVVISFQNGEFKEVCNVYSSHRREDPIEYVDLDNDGIYEIKIPTRISIDGIPGAAYPEWVSLYEWDGTTYVLNNERFYAENDEFLTHLLEKYNVGHRFTRNEVYHFYIGLVYYYQDNAPMAREFLQRVVERGKKQDYRKAAEELLKKLPPQRR